MGEEPRRIYSFNKACYIINSVPDAKYKMEFDAESNNTYFVFEDSERIARAIRNFGKDDLIIFNAHRFFDLFGELKKRSIELKDKYLCKLNKLNKNI
ncbi:hypothetical protein [Clostridium scatologenes]|uniref:Uncharacterized protein n=1 Tax=Clostridium scatologenes TaxID=1548 RepID=A0A0E3K4G1_CLOSL|nr:hypothetical protein [Clostridium scatologenes]AKA71955.1 hypothetical protein CSCA_4830 [Clostridium scatologenes]